MIGEAVAINARRNQRSDPGALGIVTVENVICMSMKT